MEEKIGELNDPLSKELDFKAEVRLYSFEF